MKIFQWLMISSKDPNKLSLTVKGALVGAITYIVFFAGVFHFNVDQGDLNSLANQITDIVKMTLTLVSTVATAVGLIRKIYRTLAGKNTVEKPFVYKGLFSFPRIFIYSLSLSFTL